MKARLIRQAFVMATMLLAQAACDRSERNDPCGGRGDAVPGKCGGNSAPRG